MDVSIPSVASRAVADLRPAADAAATARVDRPPLAVAPAIPFAPASLSQEGLVAQNVLDPETVSAADALVKPPERVLKPWGIPMLPSDRPKEETQTEDTARATDGKAATASAGGVPSSPPEAQVGSDANAMDRADATTSVTLSD